MAKKSVLSSFVESSKPSPVKKPKSLTPNAKVKSASMPKKQVKIRSRG